MIFLFTVLLVMLVMFPIMLASFIFVLPFWLAKMEKEPFFVFEEEGKAIPYERAEKLEGFVVFVKDYHINDPNDKDQFLKSLNGKPLIAWDIVPNEGQNPDGINGKYEWKDKHGWYKQIPFVSYIVRSILKYWGVQYIGFYPAVKVAWYRFTWREWKNETNVPQLWTRPNIKTRFIYLQTTPYAGQLTDAEFIGFGKVDISYTLSVRCVNPHTALYKNQDWFMRLEADIQDTLRRIVQNTDFDSLIAKAQDTSKTPENTEAGTPENTKASTAEKTDASSPEDIIKTQTKVLNEGRKLLADLIQDQSSLLREDLGIEIVSIKIDQIKPKDDSLMDAAMSEITEQRAGRGRIAKAKADATVARETALGEATAITTVSEAISRSGNIGLRLKELEALTKAGEGGNVVIFGGNNSGTGGLSSREDDYARNQLLKKELKNEVPEKKKTTEEEGEKPDGNNT